MASQEELTGGYALNSIYLWHITNPSEILEQGFKVSNSVDLHWQESGYDDETDPQG